MWYKVCDTYLDTVVAGRHTTALDLHIGWWMCEFAFGVGSGAFVALELPAYFQLQPTRIFPIQKVIHVHHSHVSDVFVTATAK